MDNETRGWWIAGGERLNPYPVHVRSLGPLVTNGVYAWSHGALRTCPSVVVAGRRVVTGQGELIQHMTYADFKALAPFYAFGWGPAV